MRIAIVDRQGVSASLIALGVMVVSFVVAFTWLQYQMMEVHTRQIVQSMRQELVLRQQYERVAGRQAVIDGTKIRNRVVSALRRPVRPSTHPSARPVRRPS